MSLKLVKKFINIESMFPDSGCSKAILLRYSAYQLAGAFMELEFFMFSLVSTGVCRLTGSQLS